MAGLRRAGARLVRELLVGASPVGALESRQLNAVGGAHGDESESFYQFLRALVYLFDADGFLVADVAAVSDGADGDVLGEVYDPRRHACEHQLKAVTRHGWHFARTPSGYEVEVIFDV